MQQTKNIEPNSYFGRIPLAGGARALAGSFHRGVGGGLLTPGLKYPDTRTYARRHTHAHRHTRTHAHTQRVVAVEEDRVVLTEAGTHTKKRSDDRTALTL